MSILKKLLRTFPLLCAAGAAGFALGRADARAPAPPPCEFAPFTWPPALESARHTRIYPVPKYLESRCQDSTGVIGGACLPESQSWQTMPASPNNRRYNPSALLLPDGSVLLTGGPDRSIDPSPSSPSDR